MGNIMGIKITNIDLKDFDAFWVRPEVFNTEIFL